MKEKKEMQIVITADDSKAKSKLENLSDYLKNKFKKTEVQEVNLNTKEAKVKIEELKKQISELKTFTDSLSQQEISSGFYSSQLQDLQDKQNTLSKLQNALEDTNEEAVEITHNFDDLGDKLGKSFEKSSSKARRFVLSLFSIRTIWAVISKASQSYLNQNEATANKIEAIWTYLGNLLAPIIEKIINWLQYGIAYLNVFTKALLGVDILSKAINNSVSATAKEMRKTVSSMDEIVNLQQQDTSAMDTAGALEDIADLKLNEEVVKFLEDLADGLKKVWELAGNLWDLLSDKFGVVGSGVILAGLALLLGSGGFGGLVAILAGGFVIDFIYKSMTGRDLLDDLNSIITGFDKLKEGAKDFTEATGKDLTYVNDLLREYNDTFDSSTATYEDLLDYIERLSSVSSGVQRQIKALKDLKDTALTDEQAEEYNKALKNSEEMLKNVKQSLYDVGIQLEQENKKLDRNSDKYKENYDALAEIQEILMKLNGYTSNAEVEVEVKANTKSYQTSLGNIISDFSLNLQKAFRSAMDSMLPGSMKGYATGGFPEEGQMFYANERGPELVGTIGSSTAVVNNTQIVDAVSLGVANAVAGVLGNQRSTNNNATYLYLNGKEFAKAVYNDMETESQRRNKNTSIRRA